MIERFFDEMRRGARARRELTEPPETADDGSQSNSGAGDGSDENFLSALPTIRKIVWRRLFSSKWDGAPDAVQKIILQLLIWRKNNPDKIEGMSPDEWQSFASKTAYHAVNKPLPNNELFSAPLDEADEIPGETAVAGNTAAELASLLSVFWQEICGLSLRQRRSLLLGSESLLVLLKYNGVSNEKLSEILEFSDNELSEIIARLPLKDQQIAQLIVDREDENQNVHFLTRSIKKARHEARAKLKKLLSE